MVRLLQMFAMFNEMFGGMLGAMGGMFFVPGMMDPFADFLDEGKLISCATSHSSASDSLVPDISSRPRRTDSTFCFVATEDEDDEDDEMYYGGGAHEAEDLAE